MQITIKDDSIFGHMTLELKAESIPEIMAVLMQCNIGHDDFIHSMRTSFPMVSEEETAEAWDGSNKVWDGVRLTHSILQDKLRTIHDTKMVTG